MCIFENAVKYESIILILQRKCGDINGRISSIQTELGRTGARREEKQIFKHCVTVLMLTLLRCLRELTGRFTSP